MYTVLGADDAQKSGAFLGLGDLKAAEGTGNLGLPNIATGTLELAAGILATCALADLHGPRRRKEGILPPHGSATGFDCGPGG